MLELCECLAKKDARDVFQDLNPIVKALIVYRQAIDRKQYEIMAKHFNEIVTIIKDDSMKLRKSPALVDELESVLREGSASDADKNSPQTKAKGALSQKATRSAKRSSGDDFVVVDKKWSLEPDKLTEHQRERMKSRRCDIPALYCDLSRSQDSQSVSEWAPKARRSLALGASLKASDECAETSTAAQKGKKAGTAEANSPSSSQATAKTNDKQKDTPDEKSKPAFAAAKIGNRRMTRELSRIQSESFNESLLDMNRKTRSASQKQPTDSPEQRRTRSNIVKQASEKVDVKADTKKKQPPGTPTSTPKNQAKQKSASVTVTVTATTSTTTPLKRVPATAAAVAASADDSQPLNGSTPKRSRQTRHSLRNGNDSNADEQIVKPLQANAVISLNNLELRVERLPENADVSTIIDNNKTPDESLSDTEQKDTADEAPSEPAEMSIAPPPIPEPAPSADDDRQTKPTKTASPVDKVDVVPPEQVPVLASIEATDESLHAHSANIADDVEMDDGNAQNGSDSMLQCNNDQSRMSTLFLDDSHNRSLALNDSKVLTSPILDEQKNMDFLNDTLNISPIVSDSLGNAFKEAHLSNNEDVAMAATKPEAKTSEMDLLDGDKCPRNGVKDTRVNNVATDKMDADKPIERDIVGPMTEQRTPIIATSLAQSSTGKLGRPTMQSSTPTQAFSPVSSKFKVKMGGRGAQLLQMINRSPKPASPIPPTNNTVNAMAMIHGNAMVDVHPDGALKYEPDAQGEAQFMAYDARALLDEPTPFAEHRAPNEHTTTDGNGDFAGSAASSGFLVFSKAMPSLQASPAVGILKRKHYDLDESTTGASPAGKRKRVSFNFPLIQTKEFIPDDEIEPYFMVTSHVQELYDEPARSNEHTSPSKQSPSKQSPNKKRSPVRRSPANRSQVTRRSPVNRSTMRHRLKHNKNRPAARNIIISLNASTAM